jgi:hypothetical protein
MAEKVKQMNRFRKLPKICLFMVAAAVIFSAGLALAVEQSPRNQDILRGTYHKNISRLERNSFGFPLFLESSEHDRRVTVDVYGVYDYPFNSVVDVVKVPANWCEMLFLHPNIKACTYRELQDEWLLTFHVGRKVYQSPEETHQIIYHYRKVDQHPGYLDIILSADAGPLGTKDHLMRFEVLALDGGRTFTHVRYAYNGSFIFRLAEKIYFATLGRDKIGFTVTGKERDGNPIYIRGPRGALERNAVRYYFAIQSFMNTLHYPEESRFRMRINDWYDLTNRYRKQLYELDKEDYFTIKSQEYKNQELLQRQIDAGPSAP